MGNALVEKLEKDGCRLTKIRKALAEIFCRKECVLPLSEIKAKLEKKSIRADRTTIYRELNFLAEKNLVRKIQLADGKVYYEIAASHHHHLICTKCKKVREIVLDKNLEAQEKKIYEKEKFKVSFHSLEFYGLCGKCA